MAAFWGSLKRLVCYCLDLAVSFGAHAIGTLRSACIEAFTTLTEASGNLGNLACEALDDAQVSIARFIETTTWEVGRLFRSFVQWFRWILNLEVDKDLPIDPPEGRSRIICLRGHLVLAVLGRCISQATSFNRFPSHWPLVYDYQEGSGLPRKPSTCFNRLERNWCREPPCADKFHSPFFCLSNTGCALGRSELVATAKVRRCCLLGTQRCRNEL